MRGGVRRENVALCEANFNLTALLAENYPDNERVFVRFLFLSLKCIFHVLLIVKNCLYKYIAFCVICSIIFSL